jgi:hypothetical protein
LYLYPFGFSVGPAVTSGTPPGTAACIPRCARHPVHAVHPYDRSVKPLLQCLNDGVLPSDRLLDGCFTLVYIQGHIIVDCIDYRIPRQAAPGGVEPKAGQIRDMPIVRRLLLRPTTASVQSDMQRHKDRVAAAVATKAKDRAAARGGDAARIAAAAEAAGAAVAASTVAATEQRLLVALYPDLQLGSGAEGGGCEGVAPPPASMACGLDHAASAWSELASTCEEARAASAAPGDDANGRHGSAALPTQDPSMQQQQQQRHGHGPPLVGTPIYSGVPIHGGGGSAAQYAAQVQPPATAAEQQRRMFESLWDD